MPKTNAFRSVSFAIVVYGQKKERRPACLSWEPPLEIIKIKAYVFVK